MCPEATDSSLAIGVLFLSRASAKYTRHMDVMKFRAKSSKREGNAWVLACADSIQWETEKERQYVSNAKNCYPSPPKKFK